MKHTLYISTLVVAAVLCGICVPAQATTNTMTFDGSTLIYDQFYFGLVPWVEAGYSMDQPDYTYTWYFADETYDGGGTMIGLGDYCVSFGGDPAPAVIVHTSSETFFLSSMVMGTLDTSSSLQVVGNYVGGGSVTNTLNEGSDNSWRTYYYTNALDGLAAFTNLASLHLISVSGKPVFDDIALSTDVPPPAPEAPPVAPPAAVEIFDFDGVPLVSGTPPLSWASLVNTVEDGYTMTLDSGAGGFLTNAYNVSINDFTGAIVTPWSGGAGISFTRNDSGLFSAHTVAVGVALDESETAQWDVIGYLDGGGTVSNRLNMVKNVRQVVVLGPAFGNANLTKISFIEPDSAPGQPVIDDLTLETNVVAYSSGTCIAIE